MDMNRYRARPTDEKSDPLGGRELDKLTSADPFGPLKTGALAGAKPDSEVIRVSAGAAGGVLTITLCAARVACWGQMLLTDPEHPEQLAHHLTLP